MRMVQKCIQTGGLAETGLLNAAYGGKTLNVPYTLSVTKLIQEGLLAADWLRLKRHVVVVIRNLDMRTKTDHFLPDLMLKTGDHGHGDDHHCQAKGNADDGDLPDQGDVRLALSSTTQASGYV